MEDRPGGLSDGHIDAVDLQPNLALEHTTTFKKKESFFALILSQAAPGSPGRAARRAGGGRALIAQ